MYMIEECYGGQENIATSLKRNSPYTKPINRKTIQLREAGIINFLMKKEIRQNSVSRQKRKAEPIWSLEKLQGIFLPCGTCLLICLVVFAIEIVIPA